MSINLSTSNASSQATVCLISGHCMPHLRPLYASCQATVASSQAIVCLISGHCMPHLRPLYASSQAIVCLISGHYASSQATLCLISGHYCILPVYTSRKLCMSMRKHSTPDRCPISLYKSISIFSELPGPYFRGYFCKTLETILLPLILFILIPWYKMRL